MVPAMQRQAVLAVTLILGGGFAAGPAAAQAPPTETIGVWRLACALDRMTDRAVCRLRHEGWVEPPAGGTAGIALEVIDRGGRLVPAVTARDLSLEGAARGAFAVAGAAQLRFPPNRLFELPCGIEGRSLVCAPRLEDAERAERELAAAPTALVRMSALLGLGQGEPTELPLGATTEALARFRRAAPVGSAPEPPAGLDARELLQRLQRLFGN